MLCYSGIYNTESDLCSTNESRRLVLRVGQSYVPEINPILEDIDIEYISVAIFPDDARAVPKADGSLPIMSYWYGKVAKIYLKRQGQTHVSVPTHTQVM